MQTGRVVSVGMADSHDDQVVAFKFDHISLELLGDHQSVRDLAWKESAPEVPHELWRGLLAHEFHNIGRGNSAVTNTSHFSGRSRVPTSVVFLAMLNLPSSFVCSCRMLGLVMRAFETPQQT